MKRILRRVLVSLTSVLLALFIGLALYLYAALPRLPDHSDALIAQLMQEEPPELVQGTSGYVISDGYRIWYESISPAGEGQGTILLSMGMASDALMWPQEFVQQLVDSGYRVIRYDYRGLGQSDWVEGWRQHPYTLADLAGDARAILDALQVERVHLVGLSMGGMVAQEFVLNYPERSQSLTILMSSGDIADPSLPPPSMGVVVKMAGIGIRYGLFPSEENTVRMMLASKLILRGGAEYAIDVKGTTQRVLYNLRRRKGYNPHVSGQHDMAVKRSGSRMTRLATLRLPTLIIHGTDDPLVPIEHGRKLAHVIPGAHGLWLEGMGHDLPAVWVEPVCKAIVAHIRRAGVK